MSKTRDYFPSVPRNIDALDIKTAYYEVGQGSHCPLLLLHGMSTSADSFRELMEALAGEAWLIAPDLPGFGYSGNTQPYTMPHLVEWLAAFIDRLKLPSVYLVGHSFGGLLAAGYALAYPEDVGGLALLAPAILAAQSYPEWARKVGATLGYFGVMDLGMSLAQSPVLINRQVKAAFHAPEEQDEALWQRRIADYQRARASAAVLKAAATYDISNKVAAVKQPTWIIWGREDTVLEPAQGDRLAAQFPHSQLFVLTRCGHIPMLEQPEAVQDIIRAFIHEMACLEP